MIVTLKVRLMCEWYTCITKDVFVFKL